MVCIWCTSRRAISRSDNKKCRHFTLQLLLVCIYRPWRFVYVNSIIASLNLFAAGKTRTKDKYRIVYTELQKVELEKEFLYNQYITIQRKAELAGNIGLSDRQVKIWFQNRRAKERKHKRKREENTSLRSSTSSNGGLSANSSVLSSGGASAQMGGAKSTPAIDPTPRLHQQLHQQQQHRCNDVIKKESGHELMASSLAQQPSSLYTMN